MRIHKIKRKEKSFFRCVEEMKAKFHMNEVGIYGKSSNNDAFAESNNTKFNGVDTVAGWLHGVFWCKINLEACCIIVYNIL